jgi:phage tail-like protein
MSIPRRLWTFAVIPLAALVLIAPRRPDLPGSLSFRIEVDGQSVGQFKSLDGPTVSFEVVEFRDGNDPLETARKLPGRIKYPDIVLKRGYVNRSYFENWIQTIREGNKDFRKNISVVILEKDLTEVARYNLYNCWPSTWKFSSLDGKGNDVLVEEVVVVIEYFEKA